MRRFALMAVVTVGLYGEAARANFLVNPSFEQPVLPDGTVQEFFSGQTVGAGWVVSFGNQVVITKGYTGGGVVWAPPTDGNQYFYLGNAATSASAYQEVALAGGTNYRLTFDLANYLTNYNGNGAQLQVDVLFGGSSILGGPVTFTRPVAAGYAPQSLDFTSLADGTYRLTLTQVNGFGSNVDNFNLDFAPTAVPEPASVALLATAAVGLVAARRRRAG